MPLNFVVDTIDSVPEAFRSEYVQSDDGKFRLNVPGVVPKERLDEFRNNNVTLRRDLEGLQTKYKDIDLDKYQTWAEREQSQKDRRLIDAGKVDELVAERVTGMKTEFEGKIKGLTDEGAGLKTRLQTLLIDGALKDTAIAAGVVPSAIEDVVLRGQRVFRLDEKGEAAAFQGDKPIYGKTSEPLSMKEWLAGLADNAPHLFKPSQGGGSQNQGGNNGGGAKTMTRADFNKLGYIEQAAAMKSGTKLTD